MSEGGEEKEKRGEEEKREEHEESVSEDSPPPPAQTHTRTWLTCRPHAMMPLSKTSRGNSIPSGITDIRSTANLAYSNHTGTAAGGKRQ